jgi:hypothetical protein
MKEPPAKKRPEKKGGQKLENKIARRGEEEPAPGDVTSFSLYSAEFPFLGTDRIWRIFWWRN